MINQLRQYQIHELLKFSSLSNRALSIIFIVTGISLLAFISVLAAQIIPPVTGVDSPYQPDIPIGNIFANIGSGPFGSDQQMKKFSSPSELRAFLKDVQAYFAELGDIQSYSLREGGTSASTGPLFSGGRALSPSGEGGLAGLFASPAQQQSSQADVVTDEAAVETSADSNAFSGTNVQVEGVDEADFLKTDGKYAYIISGSQLTIVSAYPPENATIVSKSALDIPEDQTLQNMYLNGDMLVIFYQENGEQTVIPEYGYAPTSVYAPSTHALVVDVSNREDPAVLRNYEVGGEYSNSRMLGSNVFMLTSSGVDYDDPIIPSVQESSTIVSSPDVYYFSNPEQSYTFNTVTAIDLEAVGDAGNSSNGLLSKTFMIGSGSTVYMSENNIYIAYQQNLSYDYLQASNRDRFFEVVVPLLPADVQSQIKSIEENQSLDSAEKWDKVSALLQDTYDSMSSNEQATLFSKMQNSLAEYDSAIARESQKTIVHKISVSGDSVLEHVAEGEVPGRLLNQFSMDEHDGMFRVATTSEYSSPRGSVMHNNVYVLDGQMNITGKLEGIAPDESIYAARFMGDRLYLVTFRQVDPFFVIDLSGDPPKVLGELKLPGFSNYLHPYDQDHIIGIGKETSDNGAQTLGVKMALFDVSDVSSPKAVDTCQIGGPQTESEALNDHKAFLFDREKNVLSIPIFSPDQYYTGEGGVEPFNNSGEESGPWNGFYVFGIDGEKQFELRGLVEHESNYSGSGNRSFYINSTLYTVTPALMKMSDLENIEEINQISLQGTGRLVDYLDANPSQ